MRNRLAFALVTLSLLATSHLSIADTFCGFYCAGTLGNAICQGPGQPTVGCTYVGGLGSCMSISAPECSGDPDCGFDGELCPRGPFHQLP